MPISAANVAPVAAPLSGAGLDVFMGASAGLGWLLGAVVLYTIWRNGVDQYKPEPAPRRRRRK